MIAVVDTGGANLASVGHALDRVGVSWHLTTSPADIAAASHVLLPGVGAARVVMQRIEVLGLRDVLRGLSQPTLGICVGMQVLFEHCEEGNVAGLGLVPGRVRRLEPGADVTVPHMGWNQVAPAPESRLRDVLCDEHFYFVHSYAATVGQHTTGITRHGIPFTAVTERDNFVGVQFHPEKSGAAGTRLLKRFFNL